MGISRDLISKYRGAKRLLRLGLPLACKAQSDHPRDGDQVGRHDGHNREDETERGGEERELQHKDVEKREGHEGVRSGGLERHQKDLLHGCLQRRHNLPLGLLTHGS